MTKCLSKPIYKVGHTTTITQHFYLMPMFYGIVYVQWENTKAYPGMSGQLLDVRGSFSLMLFPLHFIWLT